MEVSPTRQVADATARAVDEPVSGSAGPPAEDGAGSHRRWEEQRSFDELGRPLRDVTFCVVDLETTGGSPAGGSRITEIGAVKVRGGEVLGEFQTLVDPGEPIPAFIAVLTGITDRLVAGAPDIAAALPSFLEFAHGSVLVAHNAPFDVGFLKHAAAELALPWPGFEVLDTATLARRVVHRDEAPNCKLGSLATLFGATTTPNHRALSDARATVDVLHGIIGRLGGLGVQTLEELSTYTSKVTAAQRKKRHLAEHLPHEPGVYFFVGPREEVLYVGTSKDLRSRVRSYFTASETRSRMGEMVGLATEVRAVECATPLEAQIRELRLIARHKPRYNRRSRFPERGHWVKLTEEPWPRLSLVRKVADDEAVYLGPFSSRAQAETVVAALHEAFPIRQCTGRLPISPRRSPCALAEMGRCLSPCDGSADADAYSALVERLRVALLEEPTEVLAPLTRRMDDLADAERFEDAGRVRDRLLAFVRASSRLQRMEALARCPEIVAAEPTAEGWAVHVVRFGRLAGAGVVPRGVDPVSFVDDLVASSETVVPGPGPLPASSAEEVELIRRWLEESGVRLVRVDGDWTCPVRGAGREEARLREASRSTVGLVPFDESSDRVRRRPTGLPSRLVG